MRHYTVTSFPEDNENEMILYEGWNEEEAFRAIENSVGPVALTASDSQKCSNLNCEHPAGNYFYPDLCWKCAYQYIDSQIGTPS